MSAASPDATQRRRRSSESPSLRSIAAVAWTRVRRNRPEREPGLGTGMPFPGGAASGGESERRSAQLAGDVDRIARPRAVAAESGPTRNGAADDDVARELAGVPEIAADQWGAFAAGEPEQAAVEGVDPARNRVHGASARDSRQKRGSPPIAAISLRPRASAFHPISAGPVRGAAEVDVLDEKVGGEEQIFGGAPRTENGAIVADSQDHARAPPARELAGFGRSGRTRNRVGPPCAFVVLDHTNAI